MGEEKNSLFAVKLICVYKGRLALHSLDQARRGYLWQDAPLVTMKQPTSLVSSCPER